MLIAVQTMPMFFSKTPLPNVFMEIGFSSNHFKCNCLQGSGLMQCNSYPHPEKVLQYFYFNFHKVKSFRSSCL